MKTVTLTLKEVNEVISGSLPRNERRANLKWLKKTHSVLKDGGVWVYPDANLVFTKQGANFTLKV